jgi:hypothetical protein
MRSDRLRILTFKSAGKAGVKLFDKLFSLFAPVGRDTGVRVKAHIDRHTHQKHVKAANCRNDLRHLEISELATLSFRAPSAVPPADDLPKLAKQRPHDRFGNNESRHARQQVRSGRNLKGSRLLYEDVHRYPSKRDLQLWRRGQPDEWIVSPQRPVTLDQFASVSVHQFAVAMID